MPPRHRPRTTTPALALALTFALALAGCGARAPRGPARSPAVGGRGTVAAVGVVNVRAFAAVKGDGVTDDSAALQAIIDAHPGHTIYLPTTASPLFNVAGGINPSYYLGSMLTLSSQGTALQGDGPLTALKCGPGVSGILIDAQSCSVRDLGLLGSEAWVDGVGAGWENARIPAGLYPGVTEANGASAADGIRLKNSALCFLSNLNIQGFGRCGVNGSGTLLDAPVGAGPEECQFDRLVVTNCRGHGIFLQGGDANCCQLNVPTVNVNMGWGIYCGQFLAGVVIGAQADQNHLDSTSALDGTVILSPVASLVRSGGVVTLTWAYPYVSPALAAGNGIFVKNCPDASFIGRYHVASVAGDNLSLTYAQVAPDATAPGGSVTRTGTLTGGSRVVTGLSTTADLSAGMTCWVPQAAGSPLITTVAGVDSPTQVTLGAPGGSGPVALTFGRVGAVPTALAPDGTIAGAVRSGGVVTLTFTAPYASHGVPLQCGHGITLVNTPPAAAASFNGTFVVLTATADHKTVTFAQAGPDESVASGTARMAAPTDLYAAGYQGGAYFADNPNNRMAWINPYTEGGQANTFASSNVIIAPTWTDNPTYAPGVWTDLPLVVYGTMPGTGTPGVSQPLGVYSPYDLTAQSFIRIGATAAQKHVEYLQDVAHLDDPQKTTIWITERGPAGLKTTHLDPAQRLDSVVRSFLDVTGPTTLNSELTGAVRVNADAGTGTGGLVVGDGAGGASLTLDGKSLRLTPVHDAAAQPNSLFLSLDHVDAAGDAKLCRKGAGGAVTVLQLAPVLLLTRGRRGPRGRIRARGRAA